MSVHNSSPATPDYSESLTYRFFVEHLNPEFLQVGFLPCHNLPNESNEHRYVLRYSRDFNDIHGIQLRNEVKFAGIPMTNGILVCHAKVKGREPTFRFKAECTGDLAKARQVRSRFAVNVIERVLSVCGITLEDLPNEVKMYIIVNLDIKSLMNLARSNHYWNRVILDNNLLWKILYRRDFGISDVDKKKRIKKDWRKEYIQEMTRRQEQQSTRDRWLSHSLPPAAALPALPYWGNLPGEPNWINPDIFPPQNPDWFDRFGRDRLRDRIPNPNIPRQPRYGPIELFWYDDLHDDV